MRECKIKLKYVELINNNPKLDVSNSNALFRVIFDEIKFSNIDGNDRIFPVIELDKVKSLRK